MAISWLRTSIIQEKNKNVKNEDNSIRNRNNHIRLSIEKQIKNTSDTIENLNPNNADNYNQQLEIGETILFGTYPILSDGTKKEN